MNESWTIPNMKIVWDKFAICCRSHTKFHVIWSVSVKTIRSNSYDVHSAEHLSVIFGWVQLKLMFGAMNMMLIWCQATGNLSKHINAQTRRCHRPNCPIACCIGSDFAESTGFSFDPMLCAVSPFASMSTAIMRNSFVVSKCIFVTKHSWIKLKINFKMMNNNLWLARSALKETFILLFTIYTQFQNNLSIVQSHIVNLGHIRTSIIYALILNCSIDVNNAAGWIELNGQLGAYLVWTWFLIHNGLIIESIVRMIHHIRAFAYYQHWCLEWTLVLYIFFCLIEGNWFCKFIIFSLSNIYKIRSFFVENIL